MKLTLRKTNTGEFSVYLPKKDLESPVVAAEKPENLWGGWIEINNGWRFQMPDLPADTRLPLTMDARKLGDD